MKYAKYISIFLLVVLIPLYSYVNFYQNDDWNRNSTIIRFLNFDFRLLDVTATTFYTQGLMGVFWAAIFGVKKLPYLTLLVSVANFYLFWSILKELKIFKDLTNFLLSIIFFFNVFHIYSSIGFMTENYLLFFTLLSLLFFYKFQNTSQVKNLHLSNIFSILAFYAKQNALVVPVGIAIYFLINKKYQEFKIQLVYIFGTLLSYYLLFPRTSEMKDKDFNFNNLLNLNYDFSLIYGILIYLSFFSLPLIFNLIWQEIQTKNIKKILMITLISAFIFFGGNYLFKPGLISWEEFPYFENTFERTGFLPRTIDGTKYQFKYNFDLYNYIDLFSKIALSLFISFFILNFKKFNEALSYIFLVNFGLMLFVSIFFDRYILIFVPLIYLLILKFLRETKLLQVSLSIFAVFTIYFSYLLSSDFIYTHNYIWSKSEELVKTNKASKTEIYSTGAWNRNFKNSSSKYIFSYDSPKTNQDLLITHKLIETKDINFKGNLFINPKIYLYEAK